MSQQTRSSIKGVAFNRTYIPAAKGNGIVIREQQTQRSHRNPNRAMKRKTREEVRLICYGVYTATSRSNINKPNQTSAKVKRLCLHPVSLRKCKSHHNHNKGAMELIKIVISNWLSLSRIIPMVAEMGVEPIPRGLWTPWLIRLSSLPFYVLFVAQLYVRIFNGFYNFLIGFFRKIIGLLNESKSTLKT